MNGKSMHLKNGVKIMIKMLNLDLSISSTGYSIMDENYNLISYGTIQTTSKGNTEEERLYIIGKKIDKLIKEFGVNVIVAENQFKSVNIKTTQQLARLMGIVIFICKDNNIEIEYFNPSSARKWVMNNGKAKKEDVAQFIMEKHYNIGEYSDKQTKKIKKTSDIYDSILLGLAYLKKYKLNNK